MAGLADFEEVLGEVEVIEFPKNPPVRLKGKAVESLREKVWARAGGRCEICFKEVPLEGNLLTRMHLAHKKSRGAGGGDTLANTRCLCPKCHILSHNCGGKPCPKKGK